MRPMSTAEEVQKEFDMADRMTQVTMAFSVSLKKIFFSDQSIEIKADSLHAAIMFYKASVMSNAVEVLAKCHLDTKAPMEVVVAMLGREFIKKEESTLNRFRLMMELFDMKID